MWQRARFLDRTVVIDHIWVRVAAPIPAAGLNGYTRRRDSTLRAYETNILDTPGALRPGWIRADAVELLPEFLGDDEVALITRAEIDAWGAALERHRDESQN